MMWIFDTSAWIEYFSNGDHADELEKIIQKYDVVVPAVILSELYSVIARKDSEASAKKIVRYLRSHFPVISIDEKIAVRAGEIHARLKKIDRTVSLADCIIMASSEALKASIVTTDKHFEYWPGSRILG